MVHKTIMILINVITLAHTFHEVLSFEHSEDVSMDTWCMILTDSCQC